MYQMTQFLKKLIYKNNNYLINTHQKILNCTISFSNFLGVACPQPPPPSKGHGFTIMWLCAVYCCDKSKFTFQKKILTPYQTLYTLLTYMYK